MSLEWQSLMCTTESSVEEVIHFIDLSAANLELVAPASSIIAKEYTADELINFNDISYA